MAPVAKAIDGAFGKVPGAVENLVSRVLPKRVKQVNSVEGEGGPGVRAGTDAVPEVQSVPATPPSASPAERIAQRTMTRQEWQDHNRAERLTRETPSWSTVRKDTWKQAAEDELAQPTGRYAEVNIRRMLNGLASRVRAEVTSNRTGVTSVRDIPLELRHRSLPRRMGTPTANESWNLEKAYPWAHEGMDRYRHTGYRL